MNPDDRDDRAVDHEVTLLVDTEPHLLDRGPRSVVLQMDDAEHRCRACAMRIRLDPHSAQWVDEDGAPYCEQAEPVAGITHLRGPEHSPERMPFAWCEDVTVQFDPDGDQVSVVLGLRGRGAVSLTARRVPDDPTQGDLAGRIVLHVPSHERHAAPLPDLPQHQQAYTIG